MNIFRKRPLSLILCIMLGGLFLGSLISDISLILAIAVAVLVSFAILFLLRANKRTLFLKIALPVFVISLLYSNIYFSAFHQEGLEGVGIVASVEDITAETEYSQTLAIRSEEIGGEDKEMLLLAYIYTGTADTPFEIGDRIYLWGNICAFSNNGSEFDAKSYYTSRGYSGFVDCAQNIELIERGGFTSVRSATALLRRSISKKLIVLSDCRIGGLLSALLLGEREELDADIRLDFRRTGISHILALSGMHLVVISLLVEKLLSLLKLGKKTKSVASIAFILAYMTLVGFGASVTRAGIMLILAKLLYLLAGTRDGITSLLISAALICFVSPTSLYDLSLWLSVLATFGVIIAAEFLASTEISAKPKPLRVLFTSLVTSLFALGSILLISVVSFKEISTVGLFSTLAFSFLIELLMYLGTVLLIFGSIIPISALAVSYGNFIVKTVCGLSSLRFVTVSADFLSVRIVAPVFTVAFLIFVLFKIEKKGRLVALLIALYFVMLTGATAQSVAQTNTDRIIVYSSDSSDGIYLADNGESTYIDISKYNSSSYYSAKSALDGSRVSYLDKYIVTHYTYTLPQSIERLVGGIKVQELLIPEPRNDAERELAIKIYEIAAGYSLSVSTYGEAVLSGDGGIFAIYRDLLGDGQEVLLAITDGNATYSYSSKGIMENAEVNSMASELIADSDGAIFGCHGKKYSDISYFGIISSKLKAVVIFDETMIIDKDTERAYPPATFIKNEKKVYIKR